MRIGKKLTFGFVGISLLYATVGIILLTQLNKISEPIQKDIPESIKDIANASYLDRLAELIRYYDEVLTQSARNYAFTKDKKWERRYRESEPELDIIKEAIRSGDVRDKEFFSGIDKANQQLVKMEYKSIRLVKEGKAEEAVKILESNAYWRQKSLYEQGLKKYAERKGIEYKKVSSFSTYIADSAVKKAHHLLKECVEVTYIFVGLSLIFATAAGISLTRSVSHPIRLLRKATEKVDSGDLDYRVEIKTGDEFEDLAQSFNRMTENLKRDIIERKKAERELQRVNRALKTVSECNQALVRAKDESDLLNSICRIIVEEGGYRLAWVSLVQYDTKRTVQLVAQAGYKERDLNSLDITWDDTEALKRGYKSSIALPLVVEGKPFGSLNIYAIEPDAFGKEEISLLSDLANDLSYGIMALRTQRERERAEETIKSQLKRLNVLRSIEKAITSSLALHSILDVLIEQVITQLNIDAVCVLLLNKQTQLLEYVAGKGFHSDALKYTRLRMGESNAGRAAIEQRIVSIPNLKKDPDGFISSQFFADEGFITYFAIPLIAKGQVKGVLELFQRFPLEPEPEWLEFLEAIAGHAAIAIDNANLFEELQRSNIELTLAYDKTIEGWSRAMDLRDKETEGHTQRVTEMTLRIAYELGVKDEELVHIKRGALLHDMGKLGVPDNILRKAGPLTDEEWEIMKQHPVYAYEMLYPIEYLRPALDIPYCHHERWDSTGYPRGLKGKEIPLAARIFAVVDVWDALSSDRPYRPAWQEEEVREHIRASSGTHFDPEIVDVFLRILGLGLSI
jgi:HD-GYP domain-containing protein (c-di-GMP phosphodiesterase class II)/CHASE3 domain sensor protein